MPSVIFSSETMRIIGRLLADIRCRLEPNAGRTDREPVERSGAMASNSPRVRAAIHAFLDGCQKEAHPPETVGVVGSLRRAFPELDISDADLADALIREVSWAFISNADAESFALAALERHGLDAWENEGGAHFRDVLLNGTATSYRL